VRTRRVRWTVASAVCATVARTVTVADTRPPSVAALRVAVALTGSSTVADRVTTSGCSTAAGPVATTHSRTGRGSGAGSSSPSGSNPARASRPPARSTAANVANR
jgi:hypothetical protein